MVTDQNDPNAGLFGEEEQETSDEEKAIKQLYEKNPTRVKALSDLWYQEIIDTIDKTDLPEDAKRQMIFKMTANSILDMMDDATPTEMALDVSFYFDMYMGVALVNKNFEVDLFKEQQKALLSIDSTKFKTDEDYHAELRDFEEAWWSIAQPRLNERNPNDAIREMLNKYGLSDQ